jgi:hypothetical protein
MIETFLVLVACHLIGDYVLQSDYIATNKGKNWYELFVHCFLYCIPFYFVFGFCWQLYVVFIAHLIVDPLKARWNKITYAQDQIIHYITTLIYFI